MHKHRYTIGITSVLLSGLFLISEIPIYIRQLKYPEILWFYQITLKFHLAGWLIGIILLSAGILLILKYRHSQLLFFLFGVSVIIENVLRIIDQDTFLPLLLVSLGWGIFSIFISLNRKWNDRLMWQTILGRNIVLTFILISLVITILPRLVLYM